MPSIADYGDVWRTIADMTGLEVATLVAAGLWNLVTYWFVLTAAMPGLRLRDAGGARYLAPEGERPEVTVLDRGTQRAPSANAGRDRVVAYPRDAALTRWPAGVSSAAHGHRGKP